MGSGCVSGTDADEVADVLEVAWADTLAGARVMVERPIARRPAVHNPETSRGEDMREIRKMKRDSAGRAGSGTTA